MEEAVISQSSIQKLSLPTVVDVDKKTAAAKLSPALFNVHFLIVTLSASAFSRIVDAEVIF